MKKTIKQILLITIIGLSLIFAFPTSTKAQTKQSSYIPIHNTQNLEIGDLTFSNITLEKPYFTNFGLTGSIINKSHNRINYTSTIYYYNANYQLIAQSYNTGSAIPGTSNFEQLSNLDILKGVDINNVYYYFLTIQVADNNTPVEANKTSLTPSENNQYTNNYDYVIDKYDINIIVNENNTFNITETITAYFNEPKHGIFRTIPLKNTITRLDGSTSTNRTQVTNISVNNIFKKTRENGNYKLKIGSANQKLTGKQSYIIKYTYNLGKDPIKNYDELYYNIIGNEWDTVIGNITFSITMPKSFDVSKLGFSSGIKGSTDSSKIKYNVNGNKITGYYNDILAAGESLTIRCELPEGYFVNAKLHIDIMNLIICLIPVLFLAVAILIWYIVGRDEQIIETVEFYPPQGFNSLEVGYLYKGQAQKKDVISLLIYLADKGYIKISETTKDSSTNQKNFTITKLKQYDGNNINEQEFLDGLFTKKTKYNNTNTITKPNEVTLLDLYNNFYITIERILSNINCKENKDKLFEKTSKWKNIIIYMLIITYLLITIPPTYAKDPSNISVAILFTGFTFVILFYILFGKENITYNSNSPTITTTKLFLFIFVGILGGIPWAITVLPGLLQDQIYLIRYIIGIGCALGMGFCLKYLPKRTPYGNEILGKIKGFKNFLETAEKDKLEAMVMKDPTYFYNILPYTYVLGVSNTWIKKFETISLQTPSWYDGTGDFSINNFNTFIDSTMTSAENVMASTPKISLSGGGFGGSSSGGSSGGGSSGGGSGGGGGGSW